MSQIHTALVNCMKQIGAIGKNRNNTGQGYKYRGIEDFVDACHPIFAEQGVFLLTSVKSVNREERTTKNGGIAIYTSLVVAFTFMAEDGSSVTTELPGEGMDSGDKSTNKALSAALKYCLAQMLLVPFSMEDSEKDSHEVVAPRVAAEAPKKWAPR